MIVAHLVTTGLGPFYDGIGHFFVTPAELLPSLALSLLAGMRGAAEVRQLALVHPAAWLGAGLIGLALPSFALPLLIPIAGSIAVGALVAADARIPRRAMLALGVGAGGILGLASGAAMARGPGGAGLLGCVAALTVSVPIIGAFVHSRRSPAARIVVRVAGSWILAVGILWAGWTFRAG